MKTEIEKAKTEMLRTCKPFDIVRAFEMGVNAGISLARQMIKDERIRIEQQIVMILSPDNPSPNDSSIPTNPIIHTCWSIPDSPDRVLCGAVRQEQPALSLTAIDENVTCEQCKTLLGEIKGNGVNDRTEYLSIIQQECLNVMKEMGWNFCVSVLEITSQNTENPTTIQFTASVKTWFTLHGQPKTEEEFQQTLTKLLPDILSGKLHSY